MQRRDIQIMQERLRAALTNTNVLPLVRTDLTHTFSCLGLYTGLDVIIDRIITGLTETTDLEATERKIYSEFHHLKVHGLSIIKILDKKMKDRANIIYGQVSPFFKQNELIVDWGCGDGQVTDLLYQNISKKTRGYDVRVYPAPGISAPIKEFNGEFIPEGNGYFDAGLMTNVAHHEEDNARILSELARVIRTGGRLVVIETVPVQDEPAEFERTFVNDYVYNRLFHQADVPVPGTYDTEEGWVHRFAGAGFDLDVLEGVTNPTPLGYDIDTIRDWHVRYVFRRNNNVVS